jgi:sialic acid synthase SpsE
VDTGGYAVAAGACALEKHITWNREAPGPDHAASLDPDGFREYAALARRAWRMRGDGEKRVQTVEREMRRVARQSLTTTRALAPGEVIGAGDLTVKRPGTGLEPWRLSETIGRAVARPVAANQPLMPEDLA